MNDFEQAIHDALSSTWHETDATAWNITLSNRPRRATSSTTRSIRPGHRVRRRDLSLSADCPRPRPPTPAAPGGARLDISPHLVYRLVPAARTGNRTRFEGVQEAVRRCDRGTGPTLAQTPLSPQPLPDAPPPTRGPRPPLPSGRGAIADYSDQELKLMVQWVQGDGLVTDEQIVKEVAQALGFQRVGNRIETAIRRAIDRTRLR